MNTMTDNERLALANEMFEKGFGDTVDQANDALEMIDRHWPNPRQAFDTIRKILGQTDSVSEP